MAAGGDFFQFTTSQGGRLNRRGKHRHVHRLSIHDLTRRSTYTYDDLTADINLSIHDLTRRSTFTEYMRTQAKDELSIHDLTRRSTYTYDDLTADINLSIHDLTRRST